MKAAVPQARRSARVFLPAFAVAIIAMLPWPAASRAGAIPVPNFSFESQPTAYVDTRIDSWQKTPQPAFWDTNNGPWDQVVGLFANPATGNPYYIDNGDGDQLAYLFSFPGAGMFQDYTSTDWSNAAPTHAFNATFAAGKSYTLTVGVTTSSVRPVTPGATLLMSLYYLDGSSNMVTVAANNILYDTNVFTNLFHLVDFKATVPLVKATDPWAGKNIGIQFVSTVFDPMLIGGVWDLDNVRLSGNVVPALANPARSSNQFSCTLLSEPGLVFDILAATNVTMPTTNWTSLATITNVTGSTVFTDPATNLTRRFYKARQAP